MYKFYLTFKIITILIGVSLSADYLTEKRDYIQPCNFKESKLKECVTRNFRNIYSKYFDRNFGRDNDNPYDPLRISELKIDETMGRLSLKANITKVCVSGYSKSSVKQASFNEKDNSWRVKIHIPALDINSDFVLDGRIFIIPLRGTGKFHNTETINFKSHINTKLYQKDGLTFFKITENDIKYASPVHKVEIYNLTNGNRDIEETFSDLINGEYSALSTIIGAALADTYMDLMKESLQNIFDYIPAKFFFTDFE